MQVQIQGPEQLADARALRFVQVTPRMDRTLAHPIAGVR
jgi:hypothetical protein